MPNGASCEYRLCLGSAPPLLERDARGDFPDAPGRGIADLEIGAQCETFREYSTSAACGDDSTAMLCTAEDKLKLKRSEADSRACAETSRTFFSVCLGDANVILMSPTCEATSDSSAMGSSRVGGSARAWDLVDVDPFGSCAPFLEAAIAAAADGGVVAVASTDMAVLCGRHGSKVCERVRSVRRWSLV